MNKRWLFAALVLVSLYYRETYQTLTYYDQSVVLNRAGKEAHDPHFSHAMGAIVASLGCYLRSGLGLWKNV